MQFEGRNNTSQLGYPRESVRIFRAWKLKIFLRGFLRESFQNDTWNSFGGAYWTQV